MRLTFEITFASDFHVGAGHGLGLMVDSALLRDPDGVPVIRGTVITGLLRDSLLRLLRLDACKAYRRCQASGLDVPEAYCRSPKLPCPMCAILGSPETPK